MALAAQEKFNEAEKILAEIKETDTRARIATEIDKYRKVTKEPKRIKGIFKFLQSKMEMGWKWGQTFKNHLTR